MLLKQQRKMKLFIFLILVQIFQVRSKNEKRIRPYEGTHKFPDSVEFMVPSSPMKRFRETRLIINTSKQKTRNQRRNSKAGKSYKTKGSRRPLKVEAITIFQCQSSFMKCEYIPASGEFPYRCRFINETAAPS